MRGASSRLVERYRSARIDRALVVLEGLHAAKHALRFGARLVHAATADRAALAELLSRLAPDLAERLAGAVEEQPPKVFAALTPQPVPTGLIALAERPAFDLAGVLGGHGPIVLLDRPVDLGNLGAAIRAAAAASAAGVLATGVHDPWHPTAVRGAAGLQFALGCGRVEELPACKRPLVALDPRGEPLRPGILPPHAILAFGTERDGLAPEILARADGCVAIPMRPGVSSLNLATAVAVALYASGLATPCLAPAPALERVT